MTAPVLYIHPWGHVDPATVPMGALTVVNSLTVPALGRFASEVRASEVRAARVILLDVHWTPPLAVLDGTLSDLRRLNPAASIVVGGLTAAFYPESLLARFDVDYVVGGDAEVSLPELVDALVAGREPRSLPNVWRRGSQPPTAERLTRAAFDALDRLSVDWFPGLAQLARSWHALHRCAPGGDKPPMCYPLVPLTRGCRRQCEFCYGAYQQRVFGPSPLVRTPDSVVAELRRVEADPERSFVYLLCTDGAVLPTFAGALADLRLELDAFVMLCGDAPLDALDALLSAFAGRVSVLYVQATELAPLPGDPPRAELEARQAALAEHVRADARVDWTAYVVDAEAPREAKCGADWLRLKRPHGDRSLAELEEAARHITGSHLLRLLVPATRGALEPEIYDVLEVDARHDAVRQRSGTTPDDPVRARLVEAWVHGMREHGVYGVERLELGWRTVTTRTEPSWEPPGAAVPGECRAVEGLTGPGWEGELEIPADAALSVAPCPTVWVWDDEPIDFGAWPETRLPTLPIPAGPLRRVRAGGSVRGGELLLWLEDGGKRSEWRLPHGLGVIEPAPPWWRGERVTAACVGKPWPDRLSSDVERALRQALTGDGWTLERLDRHPTHLNALLLAPDGAGRVQTVVFPRPAGWKGLGTEQLALAYRGHPPGTETRTLLKRLEQALRLR